MQSDSVGTDDINRILKIVYLCAKRIFDFVFSLLFGLIMLVPMAVVALAIVIHDPGNPFYMQKRVGKNGREIGVLKFRSMRKHADRLEEFLTQEQLREYKREYKLSDDPRLLGYRKEGDGKRCFGAFLRRTSLDELPQVVFNICLRGNMSLIGPRPLLKEEIEKNYTPDEAKRLLSVKPGLTGYWQAYARNNVSYETGERQKMELYYVEHMGPLLDLKIFLRTFLAVIQKNGAK